MGYKESLEAAGAKVLAFNEFGSYQGDWYAKVDYNGQKGWIHSYYGSCSGCDAFQAEFDYSEHDHGEEYCSPIYDGFKDGCQECEVVKNKLSDFGKSYLSDIQPFENVLKKASENVDWDMDADEMVKWLKENQ